MRAFSIERARYAQRRIAEKVVEVDCLPPRLSVVAGVDVAYCKGMMMGAAVSMAADTLERLETGVAVFKSLFPYVPTLLAFREAGAAIVAVRKLSTRPDLLFVDGNGRLHPYLAGLACQVGVALNTPTIGVAKRLLCGVIGEWRGDEAPVYIDGTLAGMAVRVRGFEKPIYVSVGHKISLPTAVRLTKMYVKKYRLPEPLRQAHVEASRVARAFC